MKNFNLKQYLTRAAKYFVYLAVFLAIMVAAFTLFMRSDGDRAMFQPNSEIKIVAIFLLFSFIYPFLGFKRKEIYLNAPFKERKGKIIEIMKESNYSIEHESDSEISFRHNSKATRLFRMYEDRISIYALEDRVEMEGLRKDVFRFSRRISETEFTPEA